MAKITLKSLRENGIELANLTLRSFSVNGQRFDYADRPVKAYIFYYEKDYIVYTFIMHAPRIDHFDTFADAYVRLSQFIVSCNTNS